MNTPFKAKIHGGNNVYWQLRHGKQILRAHKAACSTVPFKDGEEKTAAYKKKVLSACAKPGEEPPAKKPKRRKPSAAVGTPKKDDRAVQQPEPSPRHIRSGNREDPRPSRVVRKKKASGLASRFGGST